MENVDFELPEGYSPLTDKEANDWANAHRLSKGSKKMWNYFIDVTKKEYFIDRIKEIRKKYLIPKNGFPNKNKRLIIPPKKLTGGRETELKIIDDIVELICKKYSLHYFDFSDAILLYIYYNIIHSAPDVGACGLLRVSDVILEKEEPFVEFVTNSDDLTYPIAIRISPYASQRDIIDFIKNKAIWRNEIQFLQTKYREKNVKIGKIKNKNKAIQERNEFIIKNKHLSRKTIVSMVESNFPELLSDPINEGSVGKIISLDNKKRKEV